MGNAEVVTIILAFALGVCSGYLLACKANQGAIIAPQSVERLPYVGLPAYPETQIEPWSEPAYNVDPQMHRVATIIRKEPDSPEQWLLEHDHFLKREDKS